MSGTDFSSPYVIPHGWWSLFYYKKEKELPTSRENQMSLAVKRRRKLTLSSPAIRVNGSKVLPGYHTHAGTLFREI